MFGLVKKNKDIEQLLRILEMDALEESGFRPLSIMLEGVGNFGDTFCAVGNDTGWIQNERQALREYLSVLSYTLTSSFIDDDKSGFRRESKWI